MPFELLKRLCCAELPLKIEEQSEIDKLMVLMAAKLIEADLPPRRQERGHYCYTGSAIVMRVTPLGHAAMKGRKDDPTPDAFDPV